MSWNSKALRAKFPADPRALQPLGPTTRRHPNNQIRKLKSSLTQFGFRLPILIDGQSRVVAGFGLVLAALQLNLRRVPVIKITDLKEQLGHRGTLPRVPRDART